MTPLKSRLRSASKAAIVHLCISLLVAALAAALVFGIWYPYPYRELAGGRELFFLVVAVDIVCGPLLTFVLFNPIKPSPELRRDIALVTLIQLAALAYGVLSVWQARPLYLVAEIDRFKVVAAPDVDGAALDALPKFMQPTLFSGPQVTAIREPSTKEEREKVMFESVQGGRDYAERPEFYLPYVGESAIKSLKRAKPLPVFLQKQPSQQAAAQKLATEKGADVAQWFYLPIVARQDWVAVLDKQGQIQGFLKGDGF